MLTAKLSVWLNAVAGAAIGLTLMIACLSTFCVKLAGALALNLGLLPEYVTRIVCVPTVENVVVMVATPLELTGAPEPELRNVFVVESKKVTLPALTVARLG